MCPQCGGYPLDITEIKCHKQLNVPFELSEVKMILPKLEWNIFAQNANKFGFNFPLDISTLDDDDEILNSIGQALFNFTIFLADLVCPQCSSVYPIKDGIPNFLKTSLKP